MRHLWESQPPYCLVSSNFHLLCTQHGIGAVLKSRVALGCKFIEDKQVVSGEKHVYINAIYSWNSFRLNGFNIIPVFSSNGLYYCISIESNNLN